MTMKSPPVTPEAEALSKLASLGLTLPVRVLDDSGVSSTPGTATTLIDRSKVWAANVWQSALLIIDYGGQFYATIITSNTDTQLTFPALPIPMIPQGTPYLLKWLPASVATWIQALLTAINSGNPVTAANPLEVRFSPGNKTVTLILTLSSLAAASKSTLAQCTPINLLAVEGTLAITVKARYNASATAGIKVHVVTSPDNQAAGTHTGAVNPTVMTDSAAHFVTNELVGLTINNVTDGSSGVVTANTETTVTVAALTGGVTNKWNTGNAYTIPGADYDTADFDNFVASFTAGAVLRQTQIYDPSPAYLKIIIENLDAAQAVTAVQVTATVGV
jgi:hypothetical protein